MAEAFGLVGERHEQRRGRLRRKRSQIGFLPRTPQGLRLRPCIGAIGDDIGHSRAVARANLVQCRLAALVLGRVVEQRGEHGNEGAESRLLRLLSLGLSRSKRRNQAAVLMPLLWRNRDSGVAQYLSHRFAVLVLGNPLAIDVEHKEANGR